MQGITPQNRHKKSLTHPFLAVHWDRKSPLLLAYSGGPDSKALLYSLLENGIRPAIAHVDHGWREESQEEAERLKDEAESLGCIFYSKRVQLPNRSEDEARNARLQFFHSLFKNGPFQALLLAHQADDLAETVLKRVLEGAHLPFLKGMEPVSFQHQMTIWRPLLQVKRDQILSYLEERSLVPINDPSNLDTTYLRARMRLNIFPFLNQTFGKETSHNLALLSARSSELNDYLDQKTEHAKIRKGSWGMMVELEGFERIEQRHLIQRMAREKGISIPRDQLETLLDWVEEKGSQRFLEVRGIKIHVENGALIFFFNP